MSIRYHTRQNRMNNYKLVFLAINCTISKLQRCWYVHIPAYVHLHVYNSYYVAHNYIHQIQVCTKTIRIPAHYPFDCWLHFSVSQKYWIASLVVLSSPHLSRHYCLLYPENLDWKLSRERLASFSFCQIASSFLHCSETLQCWRILIASCPWSAGLR